MPYPIMAGYNALLLMQGVPVYSPSSGVQERENWLEAEGAYTTYPNAASWKDLGVDVSELAGTLTVEATPNFLERISSLVNIRSAVQSLIFTNWDIIDAGGEGWTIYKGLAENVTLETGEGKLLTGSVAIKSFGRRPQSSVGQYRRLPYVFDLEVGVGVGSYPALVTQAKNQRIAYWETRFENVQWVSLVEVIRWKLAFNNNLIYNFLCEATLEPKPPAYNPPGALDVVLDLTVVLGIGFEPPQELTGTKIYVLGKPITLGRLERVQRGVPMGELNGAVVWEVQYGLIDSSPDFSLFLNFERTSGGLLFD